MESHTTSQPHKDDGVSFFLQSITARLQPNPVKSDGLNNFPTISSLIIAALISGYLSLKTLE